MPRVLVVEDEMLIRVHVADTFRDCGFDVVEAADGDQALARLQGAERIDAVFTDISLPGDLDGFALARWLRENRAGLPVVLSSGEVTAAHARKVARREPFFAKPCDYVEVADFIRGLLEKQGVV